MGDVIPFPSKTRENRAPTLFDDFITEMLSQGHDSMPVYVLIEHYPDETRKMLMVHDDFETLSTMADHALELDSMRVFSIHTLTLSVEDVVDTDPQKT